MKKTITAVAGLLGAVLLLSACGAHDHQYAQTTVPASCRSIGYTLLVCDCGERQYREYTSLAAHVYGEWSSYTEPGLITFGEEKRACVHCGNLEVRSTGMKEDLPSLFLTEDGDFTLIEGTRRTDYSATIRIQGNTDEKAEYILSDVQSQEQEEQFCNAFRLDPCTPDRTYARASAAESLWKSSIELRRQTGLLPAWIPTESQTNTTVRVFMNDRSVGLYRLLPQAPRSGATSAVIQAMSQDASCLFTEAPEFDKALNAFSLLSYSGETADDAIESFEAFSNFVRKASAEQFREELANYSDLTSLMDYFLLNVFYGLPAGDTAGTVWSTSDGIHWTPSFSLLNNAFGLSANGYQNTALDGIPFDSPEETEEPSVAYNGKNLLWKKLCQAFPQELMNRYVVLRNSFLTKDNVCTIYLDAYACLNDDLRKLERDLYPVLPDGAWSSRHVETYVENRLKENSIQY